VAEFWTLDHTAMKPFRQGIVYTLMKPKIILPIVSLIIIGILGSCLTYEIIQRHRDAKSYQQFYIAMGVKFYQGLERGDVTLVKRQLGGNVAANTLMYEQRYGHEESTPFETCLEQADSIIKEFSSAQR
jgi:hypothetical protein